MFFPDASATGIAEACMLCIPTNGGVFSGSAIRLRRDCMQKTKFLHSLSTPGIKPDAAPTLIPNGGTGIFASPVRQGYLTHLKLRISNLQLSKGIKPLLRGMDKIYRKFEEL